VDFFEVLLALLEPLLEALFEYVVTGVADLLLRALQAVLIEPYIEDPLLACAGYLFLGVLFGAMSMALFPHRLVRPAALHGISLLISPTASGAMMSLTGKAFRWCDQNVTRLETFTYGFSFAFGLALVRLFFAK
jgi:hypothetical protein